METGRVFLREKTKFNKHALVFPHGSAEGIKKRSESDFMRDGLLFS